MLTDAFATVIKYKTMEEFMFALAWLLQLTDLREQWGPGMCPKHGDYDVKYLKQHWLLGREIGLITKF